MKSCEPPRCAAVKDRCQCPNSWIEYLSREAAERRERSQPRLSIKRHAKNYKRLRLQGQFKAVEPSKDCRDINTKKLCNWNSLRRGRLKAKEASLHTFLTLKDKSIEDFPGQPRIKTATLEGYPVIIKVEPIEDQEDELKFKHTTKVHMLMTNRVPVSVPQLDKAYILRSPRSVQGVHIMERLDGIVLEDYLESGQCDWHSLAQALKKLLDDLKSCKILHSDLGPHNVILIFNRGGQVRRALAIDFEDTFIVDGEPTDNTYLLLGDCYGEDAIIPSALIKEFLKIDRSLSRDIASVDFPIDFEQTKTPRKRRLEDLPKLQIVDTEN